MMTPSEELYLLIEKAADAMVDLVRAAERQALPSLSVESNRMYGEILELRHLVVTR